MRKYLLQLSIGVASTFFLASCSTINPYKKVEFKPSPSATSAGPMDDSLNYGNEQIEFWIDKANLSANLQNALYGGGISSLGVAGYYGSSGHRGPSAITALTYAGTMMFGWSALNNARPQQQIYVAGAGALSCLLRTQTTLQMSGEEYNNFDVKQSGLAKELSKQLISSKIAVSRLQSEISSLKVEFAGRENLDEFLDFYSTAAQTGTNRIGDAQTVLSEATAFKEFVDWTSNNARYQIDDVITQINVQLAKNVLTPDEAYNIALQVGTRSKASISGFIPEEPGEDTETPEDADDPAIKGNNRAGAISNYTWRFGTKSVESKEQERFEKGIEKLKKLHGELTEVLANLDTTVVALKPKYKARLANYQTATQGETCKPEGVPLKLTLSPAADSVKLEKGKSYPVTIIGGSGNYRSELSGKAEGVSFSVSGGVLSPDHIEIKTTEEAVGPFSLVVRDLKTDDSKAIAFQLTDSKPPETKSIPGLEEELSFSMLGRADGQVAKCLKSDKDPPAYVLTDAETTLIQYAVIEYLGPGVSRKNFVDGVWGPRTEAAVRRYFSVRGKIPLSNSVDVKCKAYQYLENSTDFQGLLKSDAEKAIEKQQEHDEKRENSFVDKSLID